MKNEPKNCEIQYSKQTRSTYYRTINNNTKTVKYKTENKRTIK